MILERIIQRLGIADWIILFAFPLFCAPGDGFLSVLRADNRLLQNEHSSRSRGDLGREGLRHGWVSSDIPHQQKGLPPQGQHPPSSRTPVCYLPPPTWQPSPLAQCLVGRLHGHFCAVSGSFSKVAFTVPGSLESGIFVFPHEVTLLVAFADSHNQRELSNDSICFLYWPLVFKYLQLCFHR